MKAKYNNDEEWAADRMKYLTGCRLMRVMVDEEGFPGLVFHSGEPHQREFVVWIQRDPEGNGPGFLGIDANNDAGQKVMDQMKRDHAAARKAG